jgi:hypothetical protein
VPRYIPGSSDTRVCLAIDAVSHKAHVPIDLRNGRVAGLTEPLVLHPGTIDVLANDPDTFGHFLRDCAYRIAKFSFVFYLTRPDPREKPFPIAILSSVQGQATDAIIQSISRARQILKDDGVDVRGLTFGGDTKYLNFLWPFERQVERIQELSLHRPLSGIIANNGPGIFEDVLHLLKTIQYHYVTHGQYFPLPSAITATITWESWRLFGMSDNHLNDSQAHKQEDELAMKFLRKNSNSNDLIFSSVSSLGSF